MTTRQEAIAFCKQLADVYEDHPFPDTTWTVIRHRDNKKVFAWIFEKDGHIWINVKCDSQWRDLWRNTYESVLPGWHLNKQYWNSIILDGSIPRREIERMIEESYDLTGPVKKKSKGTV